MKVPRPHQLEALKATEYNRKGIINLPTGTGKSFIQSLITISNCEKYNGNGDIPVYVILSPRILLSNQLFEDISNTLYAHKKDCHYLIVHSGRVEDRRDHDFWKDMPYRQFRSTTSTTAIREEYEKAQREHVPLIISATYDSAQRIIQANVPITMVHCDEAHYLAQDEFHWIATDDYPSQRKYFYTATLRVTASDEGRGMNNSTTYGGVIYQRTPVEMIQAGEIVRPRLHLVDVDSDNEINDELDTDVSAIISAFRQHKSICRDGAKMLVNTQGSEHLNNIVNHPLMRELLETRPNLRVFDITSEYKPRINGVEASRSAFLSELQRMSSSEDAIILHIRILTEGIDVPGITGVMIMNDVTIAPFLQTLGRATRLHPTDRGKLYDHRLNVDELNRFVKPYAYVIVPVYGSMGPDLRENVRTMVSGLRTYGFVPAEHVVMAASRGKIEPKPIGMLNTKDTRAQGFLDEFIELEHEIEAEEIANQIRYEEMQNEFEKAKFREEVRQMSVDDLINQLN